MNELYSWFVIQGVNEGVPYFWSTPVGFISIFTIAVCSIYALHRKGLDFIDGLCEIAFLLICVIAMFHIYENSNPRHQMMVIVMALAIQKLWRCIKHATRKRK